MDTTRWDREPLADLIAHIVGTYHARLRSTLPELIAMARRRWKNGTREDHLSSQGLASHLREAQAGGDRPPEKEEQILFPMILRGLGSRTAGPVHVMELEHEHHGEDLEEVRALTDDLTPPKRRARRGARSILDCSSSSGS